MAGSLMLASLSAEYLIGRNGGAFDRAIAVTGGEAAAAIAIIAIVLFSPPRDSRRSLSMISEYLAARYDKTCAVIDAAVVRLSCALALLPVVLVSGAARIYSLSGLREASALHQVQIKSPLFRGAGNGINLRPGLAAKS